MKQDKKLLVNTTYEFDEGEFGYSLKTEEELAVILEYWEWDTKNNKKKVKATVGLSNEAVNFLLTYLPIISEDLT